MTRTAYDTAVTVAHVALWHTFLYAHSDSADGGTRGSMRHSDSADGGTRGSMRHS